LRDAFYASIFLLAANGILKTKYETQAVKKCWQVITMTNKNDIHSLLESNDYNHILAKSLHYLYESVVITTPDLDPPGPQIVYVNAAFEKMTGYSRSEVLGYSPRFLQGPATDRDMLQRLRMDLEYNYSFEGLAINYRKDGTPYYLQWNINSLLDEQGHVIYYISAQKDVTRLIMLEPRTFLDQTCYDPHTGLYNREHGEYLLQQYWAHALSHIKPMAIFRIYIDLKNLPKEFNDTNSQNLFYRYLADMFNEQLKSSETVIRWDDDEILLLIWESNEDTINILGETILDRISYLPIVSDQIQTYIGTATLKPDQEKKELSTLLKQAGKAQDHAKSQGNHKLIKWELINR